MVAVHLLPLTPVLRGVAARPFRMPVSIGLFGCTLRSIGLSAEIHSFSVTNVTSKVTERKPKKCNLWHSFKTSIKFHSVNL